MWIIEGRVAGESVFMAVVNRRASLEVTVERIEKEEDAAVFFQVAARKALERLEKRG